MLGRRRKSRPGVEVWLCDPGRGHEKVRISHDESKPIKVRGVSATPSIILSMIVKNESRIIERCLDAALPFVDAFVIVDTGSTDGTIELIKKTAAKYSVRGSVFEDNWVNFGHNRSRAAKLTHDYAKKRSFELDRTYMLCLDADMVLRDVGFKRTDLRLPSYALEQRCGDMRWANTRLCRLDHEWIAVGVTHEFWRAFPGGTDRIRPDRGAKVEGDK